LSQINIQCHGVEILHKPLTVPTEKGIEMHMPIMTLEEAIKSTRRDSIELFKKHVNREEAELFKIGNLDKRYVRAEGIYLYDDEGKIYLDFTAGYGALNLGHNPPEVLEAVRKASSLPSVLIAGYNPLMGALAANLSELLPGDLTMTSFGNGGAEAVDLALRTARAYSHRKRFISCRNAYHGLNFGALSVGGATKFREVFGPLLEHCEIIPFGDLESLETKLHEGDVAAFIVEPIQGEGGAVVPPRGYLKGAEELCHRYGALLILDEIQTGFGRTGKLFAFEHDGAVPDIVVLSKSLGAGVVPISVSVTTEKIWKRAYGTHDRFDLTITTFGGNPAACSAALKAIEITLRDNLPERAAELGRYSKEKLDQLKSKCSHIKEIRGEGLMLGIELNLPAPMVLMAGSHLLNNGGILTSYYDLAPTVIRFEPPLTVTTDQIDEAVNALDATLSKGIVGLGAAFGKSALGRMIRSI
jgi:putrescine aminotransferase